MFAIDGRNLPRVRSYADAVKVWDEAHQHPRFDGWRGLVNKRDTSKIVCMDGDHVTFRYHHTDMVKWAPGRVEVQCYDSQSSVIFAGSFLPYEIDVRTHRGGMYVVHEGGWYQPNGGRGHERLVFTLNGSKWVFDESTACAHDAYTLDKKRAAEIRKMLKPLREFRDSVLRLRHGVHRANCNDEGYVTHLLKTALAEGRITQDVSEALLNHQCSYDDDILLKNAYLVGGAVSKERVWDRPQEPNKYAGRRGISYI